MVRAKGMNADCLCSFLRHEVNSRPRLLAYSPPWWNCLKALRMTLLPSTSMRSKAENCDRSSDRRPLMNSLPFVAMASMMMLRKCWKQSPV